MPHNLFGLNYYYFNKELRLFNIKSHFNTYIQHICTSLKQIKVPTLVTVTQHFNTYYTNYINFIIHVCLCYELRAYLFSR